jgi:hypothetical protein
MIAVEVIDAPETNARFEKFPRSKAESIQERNCSPIPAKAA